MIAVTGRGTTIVQELEQLSGEAIVRIEGDWKWAGGEIDIPETDRFVFAAGHLVGKKLAEQTGTEQMQTFNINTLNVMQLCERALERPTARIVIIGSMSGINGSHDMGYAVSKAAIHAYAEMRHIRPGQALIVVAPPIISDSGMTRARKDYPGVLSVRRTVTARQVAEKVLQALNGMYDHLRLVTL